MKTKLPKRMQIVGYILAFVIAPLLMGPDGCGVSPPPFLIVQGQVSQPGGENIPDGCLTVWAEDIATEETDSNTIYSNRYEIGLDLSEEGNVIKLTVKDAFGKQYGEVQKTVTDEDLDAGQMTVDIILAQPIEAFHIQITLLQPDGAVVVSDALKVTVKYTRAAITKEAILSSDGYATSLLLPDVGDEVEIVVKDSNNMELAKEIHSTTAEERASGGAELSVKLREEFTEKLDISGEVFGVGGKKIVSGGLWMLIRNLDTGERRSTEITDGNYSSYLMNPKVGDEIKLQVAPAFETLFAREGARFYAQAQRILSENDLKNGIKLDVKLQHQFTLVIAIAGMVSLPDGVSRVGLEIELENLTRFKGDKAAAILAAETDAAFLDKEKSTNAYWDVTNEAGQYEAFALFCLKNDLIRVTVTEPESKEICGSVEHPLTQAELNAGRVVINVQVKDIPTKMSITGTIYQSDGITPIKADALDAKIEVENLVTNRIISEDVITAKYRLDVFAKPEDELLVTVKNKYSNKIYGQAKYNITKSDIAAKAAKVDVIVAKAAEGAVLAGLSTVILVVEGAVYESDGVTLAQDKLTVIVENTTRSKKDTTHTNEGEHGYYQSVFFDFMEGKAAVLGDVIKVKVGNDKGDVPGEAVHTLTERDIENSGIRIDVKLR